MKKIFGYDSRNCSVGIPALASFLKEMMSLRRPFLLYAVVSPSSITSIDCKYNSARNVATPDLLLMIRNMSDPISWALNMPGGKMVGRSRPLRPRC